MTTDPAASKGASMSVRDVAKAAYDASQSDRVDAARAAMVALLGDPNAEFSTMPLGEVHAPPEVDYTLAIFADDDSDVHLGVQQAPDSTEWAVWLVKKGGDGEWSMLGEQVQSLEHLYVLIETWLPAQGTTYPEWIQPTGSTDAYALGDRVTHNGKMWESLVNANVWEPGVSQWREVVA